MLMVGQCAYEADRYTARLGKRGPEGPLLGQFLTRTITASLPPPYSTVTDFARLRG